jgi:alpha-D-ribose 1-methylphosphonate 5-triphosphate diphosphatase PhnM
LVVVVPMAVPAAVVKRDHRIFDAGLTDVLHAITIQIEPDEVTQRGFRT